MKRIWYSLNGRLILCVVVAILGMVSIILQYFYEYWNDAQTQVHQYFESVSGEMEARLDRWFEEIGTVTRLTGYSTAVQTYMVSTSPNEIIQNSSKATEAIRLSMMVGNSCEDIFVYSDTKRGLSYRNSHMDTFYEVLDRYGLREDLSMDSPFFSDIFFIDGDTSKPYVIYLNPIYTVLPGTFSKTNRMICGVMYDLGSMTNWLSPEAEDSIAAMLYDGKLVASSRSMDDIEALTLASIDEGRGNIYINSQQYLTNRVTMPSYGYDFVLMVSIQSVSKGVVQARNTSLLLMLVSVVILGGLLVLLVISINQSVSQIVHDVDLLDGARSGFRVKIPKLMDLQKISAAVNAMLGRVEQSVQKEKDTQKQLYEAVIAQNKAELIGYRSQINPHFLFNTLECMRSMARHYRAEPVERLISSMALMFRYSLHAGMVVRLEDEIKHLYNYFNVMDIRNPGKFKMQMHVEPEALERPVLSMILQPILENSILHAFDGQKSNCIVSVQAHVDEKDVLIVRLADNGSGLNPQEVEKLETMMRLPDDVVRQQEDSIGLQNIFRRMKLTFGKHFHVKIRSRKDYYTVVELRIPKTIKEILGGGEGY